MSFVQNIAVCVIVFIRIGRENGELNWDCGSDEMSRSVTFNPRGWRDRDAYVVQNVLWSSR